MYTNTNKQEEEQFVNIETVEAKDNKGIDYAKLIGELLLQKGDPISYLKWFPYKPRCTSLRIAFRDSRWVF